MLDNSGIGLDNKVDDMKFVVEALVDFSAKRWAKVGRKG